MNWLTESVLVILMMVVIICLPLFVLSTLKTQTHNVAMYVVSGTINKGAPNGQKRKTPYGRKYKIQCTGL